MKKYALLFALAGGAAMAAFAGYSRAQEMDAGLVLSDEACRSLAIYRAGADGDAGYKPGVDVAGKPVVEADVNDGGIPAPETVEFNLTVDMAQYLGLAGPLTPEGDIPIARISVLPDGQVLRDGQPLEGQAVAALRSLCKAKNPEDSGKKPDFHKPDDPAYNQR